MTITSDLNVVFDRTLDDVGNGTEKGFYNPSDMNRVGEAVQFVADKLNAAGYDAKVNPITTWGYDALPTTSDLKEYLSQVETLKNAFITYDTTPSLPESMDKMTYEEANAIEKILYDLHELYLKVSAIYLYSGELYGGET